MRKSLVMLVLLTMIATSFAVAVPTTFGTVDGGSNVTNDGIVYNPLELTEDNDLTVDNTNIEMDIENDFSVPEPVQDNSEVHIEDGPILIFHDNGEGNPWPLASDEVSGRGATNTSTLLYFQETPKQVHYSNEESMILEGVLLEDNNSDGERNSGDLPIEREWIHLEWAPGTEWWTEFDMLTEWDSQEKNLTPGRFAVPYLTPGDDNVSHTKYLYPNVTSIASNPVELSLTYKGVWTTDGARFYNLTQEIFEILHPKEIGYDDDGDAKEKQNNGIDDDGDGYIDDGRPGIDPVGSPESPALYNNGIDDDGDGTVDDGYPGITKVGNPEGVDEELLDGIDNDNDGRIDEDPYAFIARRGYEKRIYVEIWHKTKTTIDDRTPSHGLVDVGEEFTIAGTVSDISYEQYIGQKTMRMYWDGQPKLDAVARPSQSGYFSEYEFTLQVPMDASAGPHTVTVEFSPGFNLTNNNYYDPSNATTTIWVRRPTMVIFDVGDINNDVTWVYRGTTIYINGSIVDQLTYLTQGTRQGPKLSVGGVDYGTKYRYNVKWGESIQPWSKIWTGQFITDDYGNFSIQYDLPAGNQDLGPVEVYIETNFDDNPYLDDKIYYGNSEGSTTFMVRAKTEMNLWMDQNKNEINDERELDTNGEAFESYITRKEFTGTDGKTYDWNKARIRGVLKDMSQSSGAIVVGVPNQEVTLYWGFGKTWQKTYELRTDKDGRFEIDIPIGATHALGPVPVRVSFNSIYFTNYFDPSSYVDNDGQPFSVVSFTTLDVNASVAVKGKPIDVYGTLLDDRGIGVGNRTIDLYRLESWGGNFNTLTTTGGLGTYIGSANTNSIGKFSFDDHIIEEIMSVGSVYIVAKFDGSEQFPYGLGGVRYLPNDAYKSVIAYPTSMTITSETVVVLDNVPDVLVRNSEARISGKLLEQYRGKTINRGVGGQMVTAYLKQGEEIFKLGTGRTKKDPNLPEFDGFFEIKTSNVETELKVGSVEVIVEFAPVAEEGVPLYQASENRTDAEVWSSTRVKEIYFGPTDTDKIPDGKFNIQENEVDNLVFTFQVLEGTTDVGEVPVTYGVVFLNISMNSYTNTTRAITDIRGRVHFNFTSKLKDTATGTYFTLQADEDEANITVTVNFVGKQGYTSSQKERFGTYERYEPPKEPPAPVFLIIFAIILVLIIGGIVLFMFYRYIERKRRLKSLKKIIKKAADQLEAGNPYSYIIFKAYQKLGAHLRRYGFMRRDADTFREFEDAVRAALPIDERSLDSFLDILEEARYSKHVIGESHKQKAIGCLRGVESSLENIILDEEAALRQMELADEDYVETDIVGPGK